MGEVADLYASLGARINVAEWSKADAVLGRAMRAVKSLDAEAARDLRRADANTRRKVMLERRAHAQVLAEQRRAAAETKRLGDRQAREAEAASEAAAGRVAGIGALLGGVALYLGGRVVRAGIAFNTTMEDSKNEVAGMLALAHKSHLTQELASANVLVDHLRERAQTLPGTTAEYVQMLAMITQPITDAKLGLQDLEDMTVQSVIAAKGLHVPWQVAARDIDQAIRGQFHSVDPFSGKVLGSLGYKGEEGRMRFNALSQEKRAKEFKRALAQPQFAELGEAAGKSFSGRLSTLQDAWEHFQGMITKPLFDALGKHLEKINAWLDKNKAAVAELAEQIGGVLVAAFEVVSAAIKYFAEHGDETIAILIAIGSTLAGLAIIWMASFAPVFAVVAVVTMLVYAVRKLMNYPGGLRKAFSDAWEAIKRGARAAWEAIKAGFSAAFDFIADLPVIKQLIALVKGLTGLATKPGETASGIINSLGRVMKEASGLPLNAAPSVAPSVPALPAATGAPAAAGPVSVNVGDIHVTSPNADPAAVALEVRRTFHEELGGVLRQTMDAVG